MQKEVLAARIVDAIGGTEPDIALECTVGVVDRGRLVRQDLFVVCVGKGEMMFLLCG
jgi:hypothetical protein